MSDLVKFSTPTKINDKALVAVDTYKKTFQKQIKNEQNGILLRPSFGTEGVPTIVGVNYFKYNVNGLKLYSYRVFIYWKILMLKPDYQLKLLLRNI